MSNHRGVAFACGPHPRGMLSFPFYLSSLSHIHSFLVCLQDIDGRFGVLSVHIRDQSIETPQKFFTQAKAAFIGPCEITYVTACYNYKDHYDALIDNHIMVRKSEYTNLGVRIERLSDEEKAANPHLIQTKLNYRKYAQDVGVVLRPLNPLYNGVSESDAEIYYPLIVSSEWMPQGSYYEEDRAVGISYMLTWPSGTPKPHDCEPWADRYRSFMVAMKKRYHQASAAYIFAAWDDHLIKYMPIVPNSNPPQPSDNICDLMAVQGSLFKPPLSKYLYGPSPMGFHQLHASGWKSSSNTPTVSTSLETAFSGENESRQSWVDVYVKSVVQQHHQTVPHVRNKHPFKRWTFDRPEMMQGVIVNVKTKDPNSGTFSSVLKPGRIVSWCDDDVDEGPMFKVR